MQADLDAGMDVQFNGTNTKCTGGGRAEVGAVETTGTRYSIRFMTWHEMDYELCLK